RTAGPTGFSLFEDDVEASVRDLVSAMLTISDNHATDALLNRVGIDAVNHRMRNLGLFDTMIVADLRTTVESIPQDAGFDSWAQMSAWSAADPSAAEVAAATQRVREARALDPARANRTTARDMVRLLQLIWTDQAGPAAACARVRLHMSRQ